MGSKEKLKKMMDSVSKKESKRNKRNRKKLQDLKTISMNCPFCGKFLEHCKDGKTHPEKQNLWLLILETHDCVKGGRTFKEMKDPLIVEKESGLVLGTRLKIRKDIYCDVGLLLDEGQVNPLISYK